MRQAGKPIADECECKRHDYMGDPGRRVDQHLVFEFNLELQVTPGLPCNDRADDRRKYVDQHSREFDNTVGQYLGQDIDADIPVVTARCNPPDHCEPADHQLDQFVGPDETCLEYLAQHDLAEAQDDHAAQHEDESDVLEQLPQSIEAGEKRAEAVMHD